MQTEKKIKIFDLHPYHLLYWCGISTLIPENDLTLSLLEELFFQGL